MNLDEKAFLNHYVLNDGKVILLKHFRWFNNEQYRAYLLKYGILNPFLGHSEKKDLH